MTAPVPPDGEPRRWFVGVSADRPMEIQFTEANGPGGWVQSDDHERAVAAAFAAGRAAATPDQNWADEDAARRNPMTDVPPEIEKLRWDAKMLHGKPAGTVWLADAEAAVLACEERCDALRARQQGTLRRVLGEIGAVLRDETATNTTKVAQIAGIMANGPLDDAPGGPCEQAVEAARLDERERLSARVYENGWCPTCGKKAVVT